MRLQEEMPVVAVVAETVLLDVATYTGTINVQSIGGDGGDVDNNLDNVSCNGPGGVVQEECFGLPMPRFRLVSLSHLPAGRPE